MDELTAAEMQEVVFMTGSKKAFGQLVGLPLVEVNRWWEQNGLKLPLEWLRSQPATKQLALIAEYGSYKKLADYLGLSETAVRQHYQTMYPPADRICGWTKDEMIRNMTKFRSVRLAARCRHLTESAIRRQADALKVDLSALIDYSVGDHENAKGRQAEIDFMTLRGDQITEDANRTQGSQATYDCKDKELGKVNVKSSRRHKYTAQTRKDSPHYWKFSTEGAKQCDHIVCMCYDTDRRRLVGVKVLKSSDVLAMGMKSFNLTAEEIDGQDAIQIS